MSRPAGPNVARRLRVAAVGLLILAQLALIFLLVLTLRERAIFAYFAMEILSVTVIAALASRSRNNSYTVAWVLVISLLPVFGLILYALWGRSDTRGGKNERTRRSIRNGSGYLRCDEQVFRALRETHPARKRLAGYLCRAGFPLYRNTDCEYFPLGELQFEAMLRDLEAAGRFIFLEYFIVSTGALWDRISDVLRRKAAEGVEVRLMYDDFGSAFTVPDHFARELRACGIQVVEYNPIHRYVSRLYINYRNHQKIAVIDGNTGYTGGTNLADEYANLFPKLGHWKDTAIRLSGDAVWGLTVTFLQMWDAETGMTSDYERYRPTPSRAGNGFYQPFSDGPVNNPENTAEFMYRQIIAGAGEYVYITTPYLVLDATMTDLLCQAAASGVDVRIITPRIWDHWYVHAVTRSNYAGLMRAGVRVYEYAPGYIHAKTIISDDDHGITGSINMDYRSFYMHFENGVWICSEQVIGVMKRDFLDTLALCEEIDPAQWGRRPLRTKLVERGLRIFAVLL